MPDIPEAPPHVIAAFDQAHRETNRHLDAMIAAHREFVADESTRIFSIMEMISLARDNPLSAQYMLAIAVDRLARMNDA